MRALARIALLVLALAPASCATGGLTPVSNPMPAARAGLPEPYRVFYDGLKDEGEWTTIEPYGYVFRPNVSFTGWQPYDYGFWVPNDTYGWVWISSEPFGWATYHYGSWMFDRYEGWVWIPGGDWGPAWVNWGTLGDYVGWSPAMASGSTPPADSWHYVAANQLAATDLHGRVLNRAEVNARAPQQEFHPIQNFAKVNGVMVNRGPALDVIERSAGPLARVQIAEFAPAASAPGGAAPKTASPLIEATRRAEEAARQAKEIAESGSPPPREVPMLRVLERKREGQAGEHSAPAKSRSPLHPHAPPDSTKP